MTFTQESTETVVVHTAKSAIEAQLIRLSLESSGIKTMLFDEHSSHNTKAVGVRVAVESQDEIQAKAIIESALMEGQ